MGDWLGGMSTRKQRHVVVCIRRNITNYTGMGTNILTGIDPTPIAVTINLQRETCSCRMHPALCGRYSPGAPVRPIAAAVVIYPARVNAVSVGNQQRLNRPAIFSAEPVFAKQMR